MTERQIGKFTVEDSPIGRGGMGVVYKAFDPVLKRHVAIKLMRGVIGGDQGFVDRFYEEARTAVRLQHQNIVAVYDMGMDGEDPYIVMEFIPGNDLKTLIDERVFVPFRKKLQIITDLCLALDHAHLNEVIHRDVKPGNVRIKDNGEVKILDFGIAKVPSLDLTASGIQVGSPYYMSPEQIKGKKLDGRADLWSLGVILYELLTFSKPFDGEEVVAIQWKIVNEPHPPLSDWLPGCCSLLAGIIDQALSKEREDRFRTGSDFAGAIGRFLEQLPAETEALESKVKSHHAQLQGFLEQLEGWAPHDMADLSLFEVAKPEGDEDDYGGLLQWNKSILDCLPAAEQAWSRISPYLEEWEKAREQFEADRYQACLRSLARVRKRFPSNSQAIELETRCRERLEALRHGPTADVSSKEARRQRQDEEPGVVARAGEPDPDSPESLEEADSTDEEVMLDGDLGKTIKMDTPERAEGLQVSAHQVSEPQRRLAEKVTLAESLIDQDEAKCLQLCDEVLDSDPEHPRAKDIRDRVLQAQELRLDNLWVEASRQLESGDHLACLETVSKGLELHPNSSRFTDIRDQAQAELDKKHKQEELAAVATGHLENQDYEAAQKVAAEGLQLDLNHSKLRGILKLAEEGIAERARTVRRPPQRKLVFPAVAASVLLAVVLYFALREEAPEVDQKPDVIAQLPTDPAPGAGAEIAQLLEEAEADLQAKGFTQSTMKAQAVLNLSPGNRKAQDILDRVNRTQMEVAEGIEQGRLLIEAGNLPEARQLLTAVLELDPENSEAQMLVRERLPQLTPQPAGDPMAVLREGKENSLDAAPEAAGAETAETSPDVPATATAPVGEVEPQLTAAERTKLAEISKLLRRLEQAYETKDIEAFETIWPGLPESRRDALEDNFRRATAIEVSFQIIDSKFSGVTGVILANRKDHWIMKDGGGDSEIKVRIEVRRSGEFWLIDSLETKDKVSFTIE